MPQTTCLPLCAHSTWGSSRPCPWEGHGLLSLWPISSILGPARSCLFLEAPWIVLLQTPTLSVSSLVTAFAERLCFGFSLGLLCLGVGKWRCQRGEPQGGWVGHGPSGGPRHPFQG